MFPSPKAHFGQGESPGRYNAFSCDREHHLFDQDLSYRSIVGACCAFIFHKQSDERVDVGAWFTAENPPDNIHA